MAGRVGERTTSEGACLNSRILEPIEQPNVLLSM